MLLLEHARTLDHPPALQVFASDLDEQAIQKARAGLYPEASAADVTEERLRRFFVKEPAATGCAANCARWCSSPRTIC